VTKFDPDYVVPTAEILKPFAEWSVDGEYLGLAGGTVTGYNHQAGWGPIPESVRPTACWMEAQRQ
jgi:hypothetical protein